MNQVTRAEAFKAYVDMPSDKRSINGLFNQLKEQGFAIGRATLMRWKDADEWEKRLPEALAGMELAEEAARVAAQAQLLLEGSGIAPTPEAADVPAQESGDDRFDLEDVDHPPFSNREKLESAGDALSAMTIALTMTVNEALDRARGGHIELKDIVLLANTAGTIGKAAGDVHKALNPVVKQIDKGTARDENGRIIENTPVDHGPVDFAAIREGFRNPPRLKQK